MCDISKPVFSGHELSTLEAHEVVSLLKNGEVSPRELVDISLARIESIGGDINATVTVCADRARAHAENLDQSEKDNPGWLAGLPVGIKDLTPVAGVRTTNGTRGMADHIPKTSAPLVERLEARGGIVVGKTNTPEFGAGGNTFNDVYGPTLNPWNTALNAGGSSGGAAASLATGETWLSHGSDHGGSLRTPAAYCGIVGLRPSPGRAVGGLQGAAFMIEGAQGPMARSVRDCALFLDAMAGSEPRFPISYPAPERAFQDAVVRAQGPLRIAFSPNLGGFAPVDDDMDAHLRQTLVQLERSGSSVEEYCPDLTGLDATYRTLRGLMWASMAPDLDANIRKHFKPDLEENMAWGEALSSADIVAAYRTRTNIYANMVEMFGTYDVFACPVVGCMPHPQSEEWVHKVGQTEFTDYIGWLRFAYLATVTGLPAISVPVGFGPGGLPVGIQLIGKPRGEAELLAAARIVEMVMGGPLGPIDPNVTHLAHGG